MIERSLLIAFLFCAACGGVDGTPTDAAPVDAADDWTEPTVVQVGDDPSLQLLAPALFPDGSELYVSEWVSSA